MACICNFFFLQVRSKPWLAVGGEIAAGMAIVTSLGLLSAAGVSFASTVGIMPFLIIGEFFFFSTT